jgi:hypothetical protein
MAFGISVHRKRDDAFFSSHPPVNSREFDEWCKECEKRTLFERPLGGDGVIGEFWHIPAATLRLHLMGRIYDKGLRVGGDELDSLLEEARRLEQHWASMDHDAARSIQGVQLLEDGTSRSLPPQTMREHLAERMAFLLKAIEIAKSEDGLVVIS